LVFRISASSSYEPLREALLILCSLMSSAISRQWRGISESKPGLSETRVWSERLARQKLNPHNFRGLVRVFMATFITFEIESTTDREGLEGIRLGQWNLVAGQQVCTAMGLADLLILQITTQQ
jgi:hypothetical protein